MLKRQTTWYRGTFLERLAIGTLFCVICKISFETSILNVKTTAFQAKLSSNGPLCLTCIKELHWHRNKPFPSSPGLCIKTRLSAQLLIWKWYFILMQIKPMFTRKVLHLASFWRWGFLESVLADSLPPAKNKQPINQTNKPIKTKK